MLCMVVEARPFGFVVVLYAMHKKGLERKAVPVRTVPM